MRKSWIALAALAVALAAGASQGLASTDPVPGGVTSTVQVASTVSLGGAKLTTRPPSPTTVGHHQVVRMPSSGR